MARIRYEDYVALEGELGAKEAGKLRLEGKDYVVREGDVMHFRFDARGPRIPPPVPARISGRADKKQW